MHETASTQRRIYLHVGAPKTGTTYLQHRLLANVPELARHGVLVPTTPWWSGAGELQFRAALDLLGQDWGGPPGHAKGAWRQLVRQVRRHRGTVVISSELLGTASPEQVRRVLAELDGEIHVIYTARDPARLLSSAWQESVKQGRAMRFRRFLRKARRGELWFMRAFDLPHVLETWGAALPDKRLHLVTLPQEGADPELLWRRFCSVVGIDPGWAPRVPARRNESLGADETQVLRLLNQRLERRTAHRNDHIVKDVIAEKVLAGRNSVPVRLPPRQYAWVGRMADRWIDWAERSGIDVAGDLEELRPPRPDPDQPWADPDMFRPEGFRDAAIDALAAAVHEAVEGDPRRRLSRRARRFATRFRQAVSRTRLRGR